MSSKRTGISIPESLYEAAQSRIDARFCDNFSDYIATLIREDVERARMAAVVLTEQAAAYQVETPSSAKKKAS